MARWIDSWGILKLIVSKVNKYHQVQFFSNLETQNSKWMPQGSHQEWRDNWSRDLGIFHFSFQWNSLNLMFNYETSTKCFIYFFKGPSCRSLDFPVAQTVNNLPAMLETWIRSLHREDPLEEEMATHSSIPAWRVPQTEEPGELQSMGLQSQTTEHNSKQLGNRTLVKSRVLIYKSH